MKKITVILFAVLMSLLIAGCGHEHEWEEATCEKPKTCKTCGETEGEALGHDIIEATCEEPMKCARCGKKKGKPLGHEWEEATCESPKTCKRCGKTEGEPLEHDFAPATLDAPKTCRNCGKTEGDPISFEILDVSFLDGGTWSHVINDELCVKEYQDPKNLWHYEFYTLDGIPVYERSLDCRLSGSAYKGHAVTVTDDCFMIASGSEGKTSTIGIYDYDFRLVLEKEVKSGKLFGKQFPKLDNLTVGGRKLVYNDATYETIFCFNLDTRQEISEEEYIIAYENNTDIPAFFSDEKYGSVSKEDAVDGYFVSNADQSEWGYVDGDGNEIAMYRDASAYNAAGYALVTNDGRSYDLIDADQNVVASSVIQGKSAYLNCKGGNLFKVVQADNSELCVMVK